ncbi:P-loop containing nucleoside triphosphate hydrolase protein [Talaromyces proteolyticus]|uniref:RNA helicase n=1 Tax=Talaromyces proteolyticus TaxID=1131652 RepID=A0AAD4KSY4_9EURO|nr:P-loop containing nucleoside triphosphate hydrolase protein [Talaromyces proteolyticus]KAH8696011.1 P-loop containing nucleoside triphosphate hydrolase protein [Talaromyces proteolyticus]
MSACFLCQNGASFLRRPTLLSAIPTPHSPWLMTSRWVSSSRQRRPSRMTLSPNVAKTDLKSKRRNRNDKGPWSNINQKEARLNTTPRTRSKAAIKRSSRGREDNGPEKEESPLYKALKMQTTLAPMTYHQRTSIKEKIASIMNFDQFNLLPVVQDSISTQALPGLVDIAPTPIQKVAIPALLKGPDQNKKKQKKPEDVELKYNQYLLAAETGSGKTLAYLVPVIDTIKRLDIAEQEAKEREEAAKAKEAEKKVLDIEPPELSENLTSKAGRPKAIILLPTSELVAQVGDKVKAFAHTVKFRSGRITSADSARKIRNIVFNPAGIDVLVSTPHLLASIAKTDPYVLSHVQHIVVDEADSLLDKSFAPITTEIIDKSASSLKQLILCSATIPRSLDSFLRKKFPNIHRLATPNLHAIPRRVQLGVVDVDKDPYRGNRNIACADIIWSLGKAGESETMGPFTRYMDPEVKKILVFVNEREEADEVARYLASRGIDAVSFSRDSSKRNADVLRDFTEPRRIPNPEDIMEKQRLRRVQQSELPFVMEPSEAKEEHGSKLLRTKVMVTTDLGSRGIDTLAVRTVILYHVPHTTIDFIHRLGRVGRMGKRGRGIVLVGRKDRKDVVREVREAMYRGTALI